MTILAVLMASLLGSVHCAGMCGGFVCVYAGSGGARAPFAGASHVAYNGGRLASYVLLGAAAGALGARLDRVGHLAGIARLAAIAAGVLMVLWGASTLAAMLGVHRTPRPALAQRLAAPLGRALRALADRPPVIRAAALGLLTTLLPCGWLYTFVVTAGGTGTPLAGAAVMATFWLGTLPMMVAVGVGAQRAFGPLRRRLPAISAAVVIVIGLLSIAGKMEARPFVPHAHHGAP